MPRRLAPGRARTRDRRPRARHASAAPRPVPPRAATAPP